jgi:hypothetical protein
MNEDLKAMMLKPWKLAAVAAIALILTVVVPNHAQPKAAQGAVQTTAVVPFKGSHSG